MFILGTKALHWLGHIFFYKQAGLDELHSIILIQEGFSFINKNSIGLQ